MSKQHPLVQARKEKGGISQQQLGDMVGTSANTVARWERGATSPQKRFWHKLEKFTERPIAEIITASHRSGA